jgi:hypothetical protein
MNNLYNQVFASATKYGEFGLPLHGIKDPDNENPLNLLKR